MYLFIATPVARGVTRNKARVMKRANVITSINYLKQLDLLTTTKRAASSRGERQRERRCCVAPHRQRTVTKTRKKEKWGAIRHMVIMIIAAVTVAFP